MSRTMQPRRRDKKPSTPNAAGRSSASVASSSHRNRRINSRYHAHLPEIARLYVECAGNQAATERAVRERIAALPSFKASMLPSWLRNPEFAALVEEAQAGRDMQTTMRPTLRGKDRIAWLLTVDEALRKRHAGSEDEKAADTALAAILKVGADIRAEEQHLESLEQKRAQRDLKSFVSGMVRFIRERHAQQFGIIEPALRDVLQNLSGIMAGKWSPQ